jgi:hypothetical protein
MKHTPESRQLHNNYGVPEPLTNLAPHITQFRRSGGASCAFAEVNIANNRPFTIYTYKKLKRICNCIRKPILFSLIEDRRLTVDKQLAEGKYPYIKKINDTESGHGSYRVGLYLFDLGE